MADKRKKRIQVDLGDMEELVANIRTTSEWDGAGLAGQTKILAAERLLQETYAKDPSCLDDPDFLATLGIRPTRAIEILGLDG